MFCTLHNFVTSNHQCNFPNSKHFSTQVLSPECQPYRFACVSFICMRGIIHPNVSPPLIKPASATKGKRNASMLHREWEDTKDARLHLHFRDICSVTVNPSSSAWLSPLFLQAYRSPPPRLFSYFIILSLCHHLHHLRSSPSSQLFFPLWLNLSSLVRTGEAVAVRSVTDTCTFVIGRLWNMHGDNCELRVRV